ncbi:hypothetical protein PsorP6_006482 [Peronosclerospora sorghi]|uniref:Uncharacterized protein n=1 Tax=Peronosclerospora sorghi TaxID=230839 RepID=A0ACC0W6M4_9STRA|nr:hypothetical protein PsorP6_006482 [Peronosclerospora sorghi]
MSAISVEKTAVALPVGDGGSRNGLNFSRRGFGDTIQYEGTPLLDTSLNILVVGVKIMKAYIVPLHPYASETTAQTM